MTADQTPTPTKFLRNCEEIGLFNELTKNPFDDAFKKAAEDSKHLDLHEVCITVQSVTLYISYTLYNCLWDGVNDIDAAVLIGFLKSVKIICLHIDI